MDYLNFHELKQRGSFDFPIEYYYVTKEHPRYNMPLHWHIEYELIRIAEGTLALTIDENKFVFNKGDTAIIQDGMLHGGSANGCVYECIVFDFNQFLNDSTTCKNEIHNILNHNTIINNKFEAGSDEAVLINKIFEIVIAADEGCQIITQGLLYLLIGYIIRDKSYTFNDKSLDKSFKRLQQLKNVLSLIKDKYMVDLSLEDLANAGGMSAKYFCKFFSEMTGKTPVEYLNQYRIGCACEKLCVSNYSVTNVCLGCGFNDLSYFVKTFKRYKGITPKQYKLMKVKK